MRIDSTRFYQTPQYRFYCTGLNVLLTRHQRAPGKVAIIVAALGVLYIKANSPKLPLLS